MMALRGGLVMRRDNGLCFVPADVAHGLVAEPEISDVPGTGIGMALVAGEVHRAPAPAPPPMPMASARRLGGAHAASFQQEALLENHLYELQRPTDLLDKEQKQLSLIEPRSVAVEKKLMLRSQDGPMPRVRRPGTTQSVSVVAIVQNREDSGLGLPLPAGVVRVYQADAAGAQQMVGEDSIEHTPRDERLEIELGQAFDVVAERRWLSQRQLERCVSDAEWLTELRNHKDAAVTVEVVEQAGGEWSVHEATHPVQLRDATTFAFAVPVPARGTSQLRYHVRQRTCGN